MTALDADVIKVYVELGMGVGIIAAMAFDPARDTGLRLLSTPELFEGNTSSIAVRRGRFLRGYVYRFIEMCAPSSPKPASAPPTATQRFDSVQGCEP